MWQYIIVGEKINDFFRPFICFVMIYFADLIMWLWIQMNQGALFLWAHLCCRPLITLRWLQHLQNIRVDEPAK